MQIHPSNGGSYGTIGAAGETFIEHLQRLAKDAAAVVAVGTKTKQ